MTVILFKIMLVCPFTFEQPEKGGNIKMAVISTQWMQYFYIKWIKDGSLYTVINMVS